MTSESGSAILDILFETVSSRKTADPDSSYTAKLYAKGTEKISQKLGEEAVELALAAVQEKHEDIVSESADLLYHLTVLWANADIDPEEVYAKLGEREGISGLVEKASRTQE